MPLQPKTHREFRAAVCLVCLTKGSSPRKIGGVVLQRVKSIPKFSEFDPTDEKLPSVCCSRCNKLLVQIEKGEKALSDLPEVDLSQLNFPVSTPHQLRVNGVSCLDELKHCACSICEIGRVNVGQKGHSNVFAGHNSKSSPFKKGRPKLPGPAPLPDRVPVTICKRCKREIGPGKSHPNPCTITDTRENVQAMLESDPRGYEIAASVLLKKKAAEAAATNSPTITLATKGPHWTIASPEKPKKKPRNAQFCIAEWARMKSKARLTDNQSAVVAKFTRQTFGRSSLPANLTEKVHHQSHSLRQFHSLEKDFFDSSEKKEQLGQVARSVVFINDMLECNKELCKIRGYSMPDTYLRFSGDSGGGSFKFSYSLIDLASESPTDNSNSDGPSTSKKKKWSYEDGVMAEDFKDTGVRRLIVATIAEKGLTQVKCIIIKV